MRYAEAAGRSISKIVLGTGAFGGTISREDAFEMMDMYSAAGGNAFDTARIYAGGESEKVVGRWIKERKRREEAFVITKCAHPYDAEKKAGRITEDELKKDIEASLLALDTGYIDLLFLHRDDLTLPPERAIELLAPYVESGLVRRLGASNWSLERVLKANAYAAERGLEGFSATEIAWALADSTPERHGDSTLVYMTEEDFPVYKREALPVFAYGSQARGFFSKLKDGKLDDRAAQIFMTEENAARAESAAALAAQKGLTANACALAYVTSALPLSFAIVGCRTAEQMADSLTAADVLLTPSELAKLRKGRED